ncbi:MAG: transketolase C-terminal domain-containing protein, partial [Dongiaceae bacterium]
DAYSVKPIDARTLREAFRATGGRLVVAEDHWPEGGLGDAILEALTDLDQGDSAIAPSVRRLAVRKMPGSATPEQQLAEAGIDAKSIAAAAEALIGEAARLR